MTALILDDLPIIDKTSMGWKIFTAFVDNQPLSVNEEELFSFAKKELNVEVERLSPFVLEHLSIVLVSFMNMWSGWHIKEDLLNGKLRQEQYFNRFKNYMLYKASAIVKDHFHDLLKTALDCRGDLEFAPYCILIGCPPSLLNTLVFTNVEDDVVMKHHLGNPWTDLTIMQLLNWPHVEVVFRTDDICFVRRTEPEFMRYLNTIPHDSTKSDGTVVEHAETLRGYGRQRNCYSYVFLQEYIKEYVQALKSIRAVASEKMEEIVTILSQFLEDVKYINVNNSIATNTMVVFRLSPTKFIRNKKLLKNSELGEKEARVGYCEVIIPKVEMVLLFFRPEQKNNDVRFEYTDRIRKTEVYMDLNKILPYIAYKCTFCKVEYTAHNSKRRMLEHLKNEHKMEQHVRCTLCRKQFDVLNLSLCRWRHRCEAQTK